ncbi:MAG: trypsin-like peptidase domain-containing protein [Planctomycetaceae bacterium]|nr:trypsin-like peptidase domain-containing protein [Planctomycetaceae bacterium]
MSGCVALLMLVNGRNFGQAPGPESASLSNHIRETARMAAAICVRIRSEGDCSSGVVVSSNGHILTTAHGIAGDADSVTVIGNNHLPHTAIVLARDDTTDVALLKLQIADSGSAAVASPALYAVVSDREVRIGEVLMAAGRPAREDDTAGTVVRLGFTDAHSSNAIRSSCVLTAGDSGGPLLDLNGQLIGIHQKIGLGRDANIHLPVSRFRNLLNAHLKTGSNRTKLAAPEFFPRESLAAPPEVRAALIRHSVRIITSEKETDDTESAIRGTLLDAETVVTKLSLLPMLTGLRCRCSSGITRDAQLRLSLFREDLAVLTLNEPLMNDEFVSPSPNREDQSLSMTGPGTLVFSGQNVPGIIARTGHREPSADPKLGCRLTHRDDRLIIERLFPDSTAADAAAQPGDRLTQLAGRPVNSFRSLAAVLSHYQPGDRISLQLVREDTVITTAGRLRHPADRMLERTEFLDGRAGLLSERRTGFADVLQHDVPLSSKDMGSPLVNAFGELIGVNIARRSRESVLALPIRLILETIADSAKTQ